MKIVFLTPFLSWPADHGGRIRTQELLKALVSNRSHEVVNVTGLSLRDSEQDIENLEQLGLSVHAAPLNPSFGQLGFLERIKKMTRLCSGRSSLPARFYSPDLAAKVRSAASDADVTIIDQCWMGAYLSEIPANQPIIFSTQNIESSLLAGKASVLGGLARHMTRREARGLARFERDLALRSVLSLVVSSEDCAVLQKLAPAARIEVLPNGTNTDVEVLAEGQHPPRLLFLGGYDYAPNARAGERLAKAILPKVRESLPDAEAWLVGSDPEGTIRHLSDLPGVHLLGRVEDLEPTWAQVSALVAPLEYGGGSRLKILEAFARGRAVITTPAGAEGLAINEQEHYWCGQSDEDLAKLILSTLSHPVARQRKIQQARQFVEESHAWPQLRAQFAQLVAQALNSNT